MKLILLTKWWRKRTCEHFNSKLDSERNSSEKKISNKTHGNLCQVVDVNEIVETQLLFPVCVSKWRCKHACLRSGFSMKTTKESSLPKPLSLLKTIAWGWIRTHSRTVPWVCDFALLGLVSWARSVTVTAALLLWTSGFLSTGLRNN